MYKYPIFKKSEEDRLRDAKTFNSEAFILIQHLEEVRKLSYDEIKIVLDLAKERQIHQGILNTLSRVIDDVEDLKKYVMTNARKIDKIKD